MAKLLVVDDEMQIRMLIRKYAEYGGHEVIEAENGMQAVALFRAQLPDAIIMDIMMPELDGFSACREIRKTSDVPILMLSARGEEYDKINGFEFGADDYIAKPFNIVELVERVKAVLRRTKTDINHFEFDDIRIEFNNRRVYKRGKEIFLKPREFDLLEVLVNNRNLALSREKLLQLVWEFDYEGDTRTVDVHVQRLRQKLGISNRIQTVYKMGYRFEI